MSVGDGVDCDGSGGSDRGLVLVAADGDRRNMMKSGVVIMMVPLGIWSENSVRK